MKSILEPGTGGPVVAFCSSDVKNATLESGNH